MNIDSLVFKDPSWHAERRLGLGGSDAGKVMEGDWLPLWLEKTGQAEPEDLSHNLAVVMGTFTEALNLYWFAKQTGIAVQRAGAPVVHQQYSFMRANLDGRTNCPAVFEAKHVGAFSKEEEIVNRYYPQCQHLMEVTGLDLCYLSIFFGSNKWAYFNVARDAGYIAELVERERAFWTYVETGEQPPAVDAATPVNIAFDEMREVDLTGNNQFASLAVDWLATRAAAKAFAATEKQIKELIEPDVKKAAGHGLVVSRSKAGSLSIKESK